MRRTLAIGALCAVVMLAACGADDETVELTATEPPAVAVTTTVPASTTAAAPPTTTIPATTTTLSLDDQLTQALDTYWAGYSLCGQAPEVCDVNYLAEQGPIRELTTAFAADLAERGWRFSADLEGSYSTVESVNVRGDQAVVVACRFDAGAVLGADGPDGRPTVVNDEQLSIRYSHRFFLDETGWRVGQTDVVAQLGAGDQCAQLD